MVGASLATQVVHANTAETTVANNSTTGDVTPTPNGDGKTYEAPAAVAEIKSEVATTPAVAAKLDGETAKEVKALDKTKLENYIAEIEAKLANGTYESKTEESVAVLKADLELQSYISKRNKLKMKSQKLTINLSLQLTLN